MFGRLAYTNNVIPSAPCRQLVVDPEENPQSRAASAQDTDKIALSITPYAWATNTKLDLSFQDNDLGRGRISFDDLLDVLDAAFLVHVEGGRGNWSAFGDLTTEYTYHGPVAGFNFRF